MITFSMQDIVRKAKQMRMSASERLTKTGNKLDRQLYKSEFSDE